jgi:uncharacterized short protein YbdD (DUF466 family)
MPDTLNLTGWAVRTARLMVGIPDYDTYVEHRKGPSGNKCSIEKLISRGIDHELASIRFNYSRTGPKRNHPDEPIMSYEEFFRDRQEARYAVGRGRFRGCC